MKIPSPSSLLLLLLGAVIVVQGTIRQDSPSLNTPPLAKEGAEESPVPVSPDEYSALVLGESASTIIVDAFFDLACSDTKAEWPTIKEVAKKYEKDVFFRFHLFPLPYHTYAFALARGAVVVSSLNKENTSATVKFFDTAFENQNDILNGPTADMTSKEVEEVIAGWAVDGTGVSAKDFAHHFHSDDAEMTTRYGFKYSAIHGVYGTPMFYINGISVPDLGSDSSLHTWSKHLDPLISAAAVPSEGAIEAISQQQIAATTAAAAAAAAALVERNNKEDMLEAEAPIEAKGLFAEMVVRMWVGTQSRRTRRRGEGGGRGELVDGAGEGEEGGGEAAVGGGMMMMAMTRLMMPSTSSLSPSLPPAAAGEGEEGRARGLDERSALLRHYQSGRRIGEEEGRRKEEAYGGIVI